MDKIAIAWDDTRILQHNNWTMKLISREGSNVDMNNTRELGKTSIAKVAMTYPTAALPRTRSLEVEPQQAVPTWPHRKLNTQYTCPAWGN